MAQKMITILTDKEQFIIKQRISAYFPKTTITNQNETANFTIGFKGSKKTITVYFSKRLKSHVVSFNIGRKKFILPRDQWIIFRKYFGRINKFMK